jgi:hypothetical protein
MINCDRQCLVSPKQQEYTKSYVVYHENLLQYIGPKYIYIYIERERDI